MSHRGFEPRPARQYQLPLAFQSEALPTDELFRPPVRDLYSDDIIGYAETDACGYYVIDDNQTASLIGQAMTLFSRMTKSLNSVQFRQAGRQATAESGQGPRAQPQVSMHAATPLLTLADRYRTSSLSTSVSL